MSVIITLIIFTLIVVIHEWGHFIVAKKCNVYIEEFAIGMGPKLFGIKKGDTLYSIRLLPIGGFCRMADDEIENSNKIGFNQANVFQRIAIAVAGPVMNFVLALVVLTFIAMAIGVTTTSVAGTMPGYPAEQAGIVEGDKIVAVNGKSVHIKSDIDFCLKDNPQADIAITYVRDGRKFQTTITPKYDEENDRYLMGLNIASKAPLINIIGDDIDGLDVQKASFFECVGYGFWNMVFLVKITVLGVIQMLTFHISMNDVSGPIGVTAAVGDAYQETIKDGIEYTMLTMLNLGALLSANLGVINLVPIPALDGGRIFVYLIEIIRRKQLPPEKEGVINIIGFVLVMGFGIFVAVNDVLKLF